LVCDRRFPEALGYGFAEFSQFGAPSVPFPKFIRLHEATDTDIAFGFVGRNGRLKMLSRTIE
jgi:hypothetical protein